MPMGHGVNQGLYLAVRYRYMKTMHAVVVLFENDVVMSKGPFRIDTVLANLS